ncbi:MAG: S8 family serine peptidase [Candidatus Aminicenantes bacterium]|nr:S8 family serine peptidase [Candidatus Aminicenantes bacterium]
MKRFLLLAVLFFSVLAPALAQPRPLVKLTEADLKDGVLYDAVVIFKDKGPLPEARIKDLVSRLEQSFKPEALARRKAKRTASGLFDERDYPLFEPYVKAVSASGAALLVESRWLNSLTIRGRRGALLAVKNLSCVAKVDCYHEVTAKKTVAPPGGEAPVKVPENPGFFGLAKAQLEMNGIDRLHEAGYTGKGVRLAVIDCGFDLDHKAFNHPEKKMKIVDQWDFVDNDPEIRPDSGTISEYYGHGTSVLSLIAAYAPGELVGAAHDADFLLYHAEWGDHEYYLEEYWFAAALERAERMGADAATSSLVLYGGYPQAQVDGRTSVMTRAVNIALENGLVCLAGAGNSGNDQDPATSTMLPPGDALLAIAVAAAAPTGATARFSSDGKMIEGGFKPEAVALGNSPVTVSLERKDGYTRVGGTSVATPLLAGGIACLLQVHPEWTVKQVREAVFKSGDYFRKNGKPDPLFICGYGIPDLFLAAGLTAK